MKKYLVAAAITVSAGVIFAQAPSTARSANWTVENPDCPPDDDEEEVNRYADGSDECTGRQKNNNGYGNGAESGPPPGNSGAHNPQLIEDGNAGPAPHGKHDR